MSEDQAIFLSGTSYHVYSSDLYDQRRLYTAEN